MRKVEVVEYDPSWPERFETERDLLRQTLAGVALEVHHIGSTSVVGLAAKPIIDILVEVTDLASLDGLDENMQAVGYRPKGEFGIPGRRYYQKGRPDRTHHVHAFAAGDPNVERHITFRDYLRSNPDIAREYGQLKKRIAETCDNSIEKYCDGKDEYVKRHEAEALRLRASGR